MAFNRIMAIKATILGVVATTLISGQTINTRSSASEIAVMQELQAAAQAPTLCNLFPWLCGWQKEPVKQNTVAIAPESVLVASQGNEDSLTLCDLMPWLCGWQKEPVKQNTVAINVPSGSILGQSLTQITRAEIKQS